MKMERYRQAVDSWERVNAVQEDEQLREAQTRDLEQVINDFQGVFEFLKTQPDFAPPTSGLVEQQRLFQKLAHERTD
jgi:hypothetical protein